MSRLSPPLRTSAPADAPDLFAPMPSALSSAALVHVTAKSACAACGHSPAPSSSTVPLANAPTTSLPPPPPPPPPPQWRKILYEAQPYEDNFTPESFLSSAVLNPNRQTHTFLRLLLGTMPVTQNISCTAIFFYVFHNLVRDRLSPSTVVFGNFCAFFLGYAIVALVRWRVPHATDTTASSDAAYVASMRATERQRAAAAAAAASTAATSNAEPFPAVAAATATSALSIPTSTTSNTPSAATPVASILASSSTNGISAAAAVSRQSWTPSVRSPRALAVLPPCADNGWARVSALLPATVRTIGRPLVRLWALCERVIIFCAVLHTMSPVLRTLTLAFSEDTIAALSLLCSTLHIFLFDYDAASAANARFFGTVSLNAAIFSSLLLASRLPAAPHVFAFVSFAFALFAGMPIVLVRVRRASRALHAATTAVLVLLAAHALAAVSATLCACFAIACAFITIGCPVWLMHVQQYKNEIRGPWDYDDRKEIDEL